MTAVAQAALPVLHHLILTEAGRTRLDEVLVFLEALDTKGHALAAKARTQLTERLLYLDGYGGTVSETDPRRRFRVTLGRDLYPLSFTVTWHMLRPDSGEHVYSMNGGLLWHGHGDPGAVCIEADLLWAIHT